MTAADRAELQGVSTERAALRLRRIMDVPVAGTRLSDITIESMRTAFASDAETPPGGVDPAVLVDVGRAVHVPFNGRTDSGNPMSQIGRPKVAKTLPKALPAGPVAAPLSAMETDTQ
jgi:hypothetical protein